MLGNIHLRVAETPVQEVAVHRPDVVVAGPRSFASSTAALEVPEVGCIQAAHFVVPSVEHTLVLFARVRVVPFPPGLSPIFLVLYPATLSPFASTSLFPAPSLFLVCLSHNHMGYAFLHMRFCRMPSLLEAQVELQDPPFSRIDSHCAWEGEDFRIFEVEVGH